MTQSLLNIEVSVSADGKLELPPELQEQFEPLARYKVIFTNNEIVFKKISLTWEELSKRIEASGVDPEQPSLQEISEIVKESRESRKATKECE